MKTQYQIFESALAGEYLGYNINTKISFTPLEEANKGSFTCTATGLSPSIVGTYELLAVEEDNLYMKLTEAGTHGSTYRVIHASYDNDQVHSFVLYDPTRGTLELRKLK